MTPTPTLRPRRRRNQLAAMLLSTGLSCLALDLMAPTVPAFQQAPRAKEPTDGFFDIPVDPNAVEEPSYGVPAYMITAGLGALAMFILCKSARR